MKLKEYLALRDPGAEVTCWDKDVDNEFYFYSKEPGKTSLYGKDFPNVDKCIELLTEHLDVVKIRDKGIEVNLYEFLENSKIIEFAKKNMFEEYQYEDDSDVVMMLFDDNVKNFSNGYEGFSGLMVQCLNEAFENPALERSNVDPKMKYGDMLKFLNNNGILLMQPIIADCVDTLLPIGWNGTEEDYEAICEKCFDAYLDCPDTDLDVWDIVKKTIEDMDLKKDVSLDNVVRSCEEMSKNGELKLSEKTDIDKER